jgi:hypothetical protein
MSLSPAARASAEKPAATTAPRRTRLRQIAAPVPRVPPVNRRRVRSANLRRRPMSVDRESVSADPWCRPVSLVRSHREHPRSWPSRHRTPSTSDSRPVGRRPRSRAAGSGRRVQHGGPHPMGGEQRELDVESSVTRDPGPVRRSTALLMARGGGHRRWRTEKTAPSGSLSTAMRPTSARSKGATDTMPPSWPTRLTISSVSATAK